MSLSVAHLWPKAKHLCAQKDEKSHENVHELENRVKMKARNPFLIVSSFKVKRTYESLDDEDGNSSGDGGGGGGGGDGGGGGGGGDDDDGDDDDCLGNGIQFLFTFILFTGRTHSP